MKTFGTKFRRAATAALTASALMIGAVAVAPSATAARNNIWADVYYNSGCNTGGYSKLSTGIYTDSLGFTVSGLRYSEYAGGNQHAHGAWMSHIGSVMVQPWAQVRIFSPSSTVPTTLVNSSGAPRCFAVDASKSYQTLVISGI